jgi:hypothetical protein
MSARRDRYLAAPIVPAAELFWSSTVLGYGRICGEALSPIERLLGQLRFAAIR